MTVKELLLRVICAIFFVFVVLIAVIPACIVPDAKPDNAQKTRYWSIGAMRNTFAYAVYASGHTNILDYINSIENVQRFPYFVKSETIRKIVEDSGIEVGRLSFYRGARFYEDGTFFDAWGQPILVTLTTNLNGNVYIIFQSFGQNNKSDNGEGDDILIQFDQNMSPVTGDVSRKDK